MKKIFPASFNWSNFCYALLIVEAAFLFIYSFTQVDLNLTLSSNSLYLQAQSYLTQLGYFNRPLSTFIYIVIVISLLITYFGLIYQSKMGKLELSKHIKVSLIVSILLTLAYPAFSYDIFNYIFDARILVEHSQNPYTHMALDFPSDDWTRFMRWTHRTYPYGPTWLPITIPAYFVGLGKFITTLISFKLLGLVGYWLGGWGIYKVMKTYQPKLVSLGMVLYLSNPLILIEGLVSAHLDMLMAGLMLAGLGLMVTNKKMAGYISVGISIGIKYVSGAVVVPLWLWQRKTINYSQFVVICVALSYVLTLIVISQREILPWYFLVPFGLTVLLPKSQKLVALMIGLTPALLLRYAPFLYYGDYIPQVIWWRNGLTVVVGTLLTLVSLFTLKKYKY